MKKSEGQNSAKEESHRYSTASVVEEYLYAAPTKYVNAGKTNNLLTSVYCYRHKIPRTKYQE